MTSEYTKQAEEFLTTNSITFSAALIGSDCPQFCEDARKGIDMDKVNTYPRKTHIHGKHYRCTLARSNKSTVAFTVDFWNSYNDEEFNAWKFGNAGLSVIRENAYWDKFKRERSSPRKLPTAYDVLASIQKSDVGTFEDFCGDFGYDSDSRQAEKTYHAVAAEWKRVRAFFTEAEIEAMQEIN